MSRYCGVWWEVAHSKCIPYAANCRTVRAEYCYNPETCCAFVKHTCLDCDNCPIKQSCGTITKGCEPGKYLIQFKGSDKCMNYWVHWTDYTHYAIVGNGHGMVWILSRSKKYTPEDMAKLAKLVKLYGYDSRDLQVSKHVTGTQSKIRFIHNLFEGPSFDIYINGDKIIESIEYRRITDYIGVKAKNAFIEVKLAGDGISLLTETIDLVHKQDYTFIVSGTTQVPPCPIYHLMVIKDNNVCPLPCTSHIRFIPSNGDIKAVDVWINDEPKFVGMEYPFLSDVREAECCDKYPHVSIKSGDVKFQLKMKGTDNIIFEQTLEFKPQRVYTLMPSGRFSDDETVEGLVLMHTIGLDYCVSMC